MRFNLSQDRVDNLKEYMIRFLKRDLHFNEFWALREINFEVKKGERLGVLGLNGSGKSTLLKIVSGVLKPTTGYVQTKGKLAPLLELGAGFSQEYTGRENIYLYGAVLGYSKEFLDEKFDEIVDFSELGVTVLFVSHSLEQVQRICDRAIILDGGHLVAKGPVDKVARIYKNMTE